MLRRRGWAGVKEPLPELPLPSWNVLSASSLWEAIDLGPLVSEPASLRQAQSSGSFFRTGLTHCWSHRWAASLQTMTWRLTRVCVSKKGPVVIDCVKQMSPGTGTAATEPFQPFACVSLPSVTALCDAFGYE